MAAPQITVTFNPPLASDSGSVFDAKAFDTIGKLNPWGLEANDIAEYCGAQSNSALASAVAAAAGSLDEADRAGFAGQLVGVEDGPGYPLAGFDVEEIPEATQAQAEAGTGTGVYMSPLRTKQAIEANGWVVLSDTTFTNVANADVALPAGYDDYRLRIVGIKPATDNVDIRVRTSADGVTFASGASDYNYNRTDISDTTESFINLNDGTFKLGNAASEAGWFGDASIFQANSTSLNTCFTFRGAYVTTATATVETYCVGQRLSTAVVRSVRFYFSAGNVASGRVIVEARKL